MNVYYWLNIVLLINVVLDYMYFGVLVEICKVIVYCWFILYYESVL